MLELNLINDFWRVHKFVCIIENTMHQKGLCRFYNYVGSKIWCKRGKMVSPPNIRHSTQLEYLNRSELLLRLYYTDV